VEKCTFCAERLDDGRAPLCVEVCPVKALIFGDLSDETCELRRRLKTQFALRRKSELGTGPMVFYMI
jgi:molybdopterin-containing oxidoreductase family iron-sulfur binding subunit